MNHHFRFSLGLPLGAVLALLGTHLAQAPPAPTVGVVDFVQVFENYPKYVKATQEVDGLRKQHQQQLDQQAAKLDELELRIKQLDPESRQRAELELQYKLLSDELKGKSNIYEIDLRRARLQALVEGYADIEKAIAQVAKDKGVQLVLRQRKDPGTDSLVVRQESYQQRNVWHADAALDLTPAVINVLKVLPSGQGGEK